VVVMIISICLCLSTTIFTLNEVRLKDRIRLRTRDSQKSPV